MSKGFLITVEDLDTGETRSKVVGEGDYLLIPCAPCYLDGVQQYNNGTVQLTIKGHSPRPVEPSGVSQEGGNT